MDLGQLANLGEFIGGVAVLVTLIYLAIQVRNTRAEQQYRGANNLLGRTYDAYAPVYEGRNAEIFWNGLSEAEPMTDTDRFVFDLLMRRHMGALSEGLRDYYAGMINQEVVDFLGNHYRIVLGSKPGGRSWFEKHREEFEGEIELFALMRDNR